MLLQQDGRDDNNVDDNNNVHVAAKLEHYSKIQDGNKLYLSVFRESA
jgi:hypothetical protein